MYQQHMLMKIRKTVWKFTLSKYHDRCLASFKHPKLPINIKIPVTLQQIVYICMTALSPNPGVTTCGTPDFESMNYLCCVKFGNKWLCLN